LWRILDSYSLDPKETTMPRTPREDQPVSKDLAEVKENFDELLELVTEWERGEGKEWQLEKVAIDILHLLFLIPRDLLQAGLKFRQLEKGRVLALQIEKRTPRTTDEVRREVLE
jgi:hypothetical protein